MTKKRIQLNKIFLQNFHSVFGSNLNCKYLAKLSIDQFKSNESMGIKKALEIAKADENFMKMKFLGQKPIYPFHIIWRRIDKYGNLKFLRIKDSQLSDPQYQRAVLTALGYYRLFNLPVDEKVLESIHLEGSKISVSFLDEIEDFARRFFEARGIKPFAPDESGYPIYATTKAGANGPTAMGITSLKDLMFLLKHGLLRKVKDLAFLTYDKTLYGWFIKIIDASLAMVPNQVDIKSSGITTRLHLLSEGGGKTRVICIPDIWTQSALKPIHHYLMNCLKKMPCDGTFSHKILGNYVRKVTSRNGMYCFDLKSATDRFPLEIQKRVLKPLLGNLVDAWASLMTERDFSYKDRTLRYTVGQPMGMLSSWAAFSVTHHIIINYCKGDNSPYAMIGDDMAMTSVEGARKYEALMNKIGVEISKEKSLHPKLGMRVAEIAKRQFISGVEISPIPPRVLIESTKSLEGFIEFLEVLSSRTDNFRSLPEFDWADSICRLLRNNREFDSDKVRRILTCPIIDIIPSLEHIKEVQALFSEVTSSPWDTSIPKQSFIQEFENFMYNEAVSILNTNSLVMISQGIPPELFTQMGISVNVPRTSKLPTTPIILDYLAVKQMDIQNMISIYGASHHRQEDNGLTIGPIEVLKMLLSEPDPLSPKDFMEKRKIRRKNTINLINRYYDRTKFKSKSL